MHITITMIFSAPFVCPTCPSFTKALGGKAAQRLATKVVCPCALLYKISEAGGEAWCGDDQRDLAFSILV